jgi:hypothetical protein
MKVWFVYILECSDGNHAFKARATWPFECTEMKCTTCEQTRRPTEEEMKEIIKSRS